MNDNALALRFWIGIAVLGVCAYAGYDPSGWVPQFLRPLAGGILIGTIGLMLISGGAYILSSTFKDGMDTVFAVVFMLLGAAFLVGFGYAAWSQSRLEIIGFIGFGAFWYWVIIRGSIVSLLGRAR